MLDKVDAYRLDSATFRAGSVLVDVHRWPPLCIRAIAISASMSLNDFSLHRHVSHFTPLSDNL
jgi:hypothetical protein